MRHPDELAGWVQVARLGGQCAFCKSKLTDGATRPHAMAACEWAQPWFPHATKCARYEPEDMDE